MTDRQTRTTLRVPLRPITLTKHDLLDLCEIVRKATANDPSPHISFQLEGHSEVIDATTPESLAEARFPREVTRLYLYADSWTHRRKISVVISDQHLGLATYASIEVTGEDVDWVSARTRELEDFISDHRSFHWIFQSWFPVMLQLLVFSTLLGFSLYGTALREAAITVAIAAAWVYLFVVKSIFRTLVIDTGRPSALKTIRRLVAFVVPTIFLALLANILTQLLTKR